MINETRHTLFEHIARVLRYVWDPIGLGSYGPADEYDSYVPDVLALVQGRTTSETALAAYLMRIQAEEMSVVPPPAATTRAARALLGLRSALASDQNVLVRQETSLDGLQCLWVFRRPDGLCFYEQALLRHELDENGAWSWWQPDRPSGLFSDANAAFVEARAALDWAWEVVEADRTP